MSASPAHYHKPTRCVSVLSPFLGHVNTGTLALVMFVAVALLNTTHGKNSEPRESIPPKAAKTEVVIDNFSFSPKTLRAPVGTTVAKKDTQAVSAQLTDEKFN
jgi:plastocyanin